MTTPLQKAIKDVDMKPGVACLCGARRKELCTFHTPSEYCRLNKQEPNHE